MRSAGKTCLLLFLGLFLLRGPVAEGSVPEDLLSGIHRLTQSTTSDSLSYYSLQTLSLARSYQDSLKLIETLLIKGKELEKFEAYSEAVIPYYHCLRLAESTHQKREIAESSLGLSNIYFRLGKTEQAFEFGNRSLQIYQELKDTINETRAVIILGQAYIDMGKYDDVLSLYKSDIDRISAVGDSNLLADLLDHIGVVYSFKKDFDQALTWHEKALAINENTGNRLFQSINLANMGEIYLRKGDHDKALKTLGEAYDIAEQEEFASLILFILYTLGETYSTTGRSDKAVQHFSQSLTLAKQYKLNRELPFIYRLMTEHYERLNHPWMALKYHKEYSSIKDTLNMIANSFLIDALKVEKELEQKEYELQQNQSMLRTIELEKELSEKNLEASRKLIQLQYVIIISVILIVLIFAILGYKANQRRKQLKTANNTKDILFSIIGHDLKNSVGSLRPIVQMLLDPYEEEKDKFIRMLEHPVNNSIILLQDLITWSHTLKDENFLIPEPVLLSELTAEIFAIYKDPARQKNISLRAELDPDAQIIADKNMISTILRNLIGNALKFTKQGGEVLVRLERTIYGKKITVQDNGIGMDKRTISRILEEDSFYSTFGTRDEKGSGIGIMICKKLCDAYGSRLIIESTPGIGTSISFTLPDHPSKK